MTRPVSVALAACEVAHVLRWAALVVAAWFVGYVILGPASVWFLIEGEE